ncbi:MAG TPA: PilZ domain-containing protein [Acidimicrobiales bacterium]|jgi:hypothetical protein|nr:PilZ domain-containing protein [Acidimicrobiales bacterium]
MDTRRVERQRAGWNGACHIEGRSPAWRYCQIIDISMLGVGIQFQDRWPTDLVGRRVSVEVPPIGHLVGVRLEGEIRNAIGHPDGAVRIGIEFDELSATQRSVVDLLTMKFATL